MVSLYNNSNNKNNLVLAYRQTGLLETAGLLETSQEKSIFELFGACRVLYFFTAKKVISTVFHALSNGISTFTEKFIRDYHFTMFISLSHFQSFYMWPNFYIFLQLTKLFMFNDTLNLMCYVVALHKQIKLNRRFFLVS